MAGFFVMVQDAVMKYMSRLLREKRLANSSVLKVQNEMNIWMSVFFTLFFYGNNLDVMIAMLK